MKRSELAFSISAHRNRDELQWNVSSNPVFLPTRWRDLDFTFYICRGQVRTVEPFCWRRARFARLRSGSDRASLFVSSCRHPPSLRNRLAVEFSSLLAGDSDRPEWLQGQRTPACFHACLR